MSEKFRWRSAFIEACFILASILLAFWIDAAWETRQEKVLEDQSLAAVGAEVEENLRALARTRSLIERSQRGVDGFLRATPRELEGLSQDSISSVIISLSVPWTFRPARAAAEVYSALPASGSDGSFENRQLVSELFSRFDGADGRAARVSSTSAPVFDHLARHSVGSASAGLERLNPMAARASVDVLANLREDEAFVAAVIQMAHWREVYLSGLSEVEETLEALAAASRSGR